jgi:hypothetical protein
MLSEVLVLVGAGAITVWGVGHIVPTRAVVTGFGELSTDNRRILTMEWLVEGLTLCFVGILSLIVTLSLGVDARATTLVNCALAGFLVVLAGLSAATGARTSIVPMKLCPYVKTTVAVLLIVGSLL